MCNCNQCLEHVDCTCPTVTGVSSAQTVVNITNIYTPAQSIAGAGYNVILYTNNSGSTQTVLVEANLYTTAVDVSVITTTYLNTGVALTGNGMCIRENAPLKNDHTHYLAPTTLANGENISITVQSSIPSGQLRWLKAVVYKY